MILAIDCGLSSVKVALATPAGRIVETEREPYPTQLARERAEQSPNDWWEALVTACGRLTNPHTVTTVVTTGHMHATVLLDGRGHPLLPCLTLQDRRGSHLLDQIDADAYQAATGQVLDAALPFAKLLWLATESPSTLERAAVLLAPKDYLRFRLTGSVSTDPIDAAGTGLYDPFSRRWSDRVLSWIDLDRRTLPTVRSPVTRVGSLRADSAAALRLPRDATVLTGAGDDIELLGATAYRQDTAVEHVGTTGAITRSTNRQPGPLYQLAPSAELSPTALCDTFAISASLANVGSVFTWVRDRLDIEPLEALSEQPSVSDPVALPYLLAERFLDTGISVGAAIGDLDFSHGRREIARAMLTAVAVSLSDRLRELERASGPIMSIITSGGTQDERWLRLRAAAYRRPILTLADDATMQGCVELAVYALDDRRPITALASELRRIDARIEPDALVTSVLTTMRERQHDLRERLVEDQGGEIASVVSGRP